MFHDIINHLHAVGFVCRAYLPEALMCALIICLLVHFFLLGKKFSDSVRSLVQERRRKSDSLKSASDG